MAAAPAIKWRRLNVAPESGSVLPLQQAHPRYDHRLLAFTTSSPLPSAIVSAFDDRHRPRPAGGRALDLDRETRHGEPGRGQLLEVVQLFDVAVADVASGLVAFPDQAGIPGFGVFLRGVDEGCIPAPAVNAGQAHPALEQIHRRLIAHAAAGIDVILPAVFGSGAGVDDDDLERRKRVADTLE